MADFVVLFMVVTDVDDLEGTLEETFRVLVPGGRPCLAMGHPIQGIGDFSGDDRDGPYVVQRPYFEPRQLTYWAERAGQKVALNFVHRPLSAYTAALASAGSSETARAVTSVIHHDQAARRPSSMKPPRGLEWPRDVVSTIDTWTSTAGMSAIRCMLSNTSSSSRKQPLPQ